MSVILLAHEAWFVPSPERFPLQWGLLTAAPTLTAVALALGDWCEAARSVGPVTTVTG